MSEQICSYSSFLRPRSSAISKVEISSGGSGYTYGSVQFINGEYNQGTNPYKKLNIGDGNASFEVIIPPKGYHRRTWEVCKKYNILCISDEVVTGFGRLGHWFSSEEVFGFVPDWLSEKFNSLK